MEFCFPEMQDDKFLTKKKGKLTTKTKSRNSFAGRRAHHNALEQQRRGVIRSCFESLRKSVPALASEEKKLSRSGILRETARYIKMAKERIAEHISDLESLRLQNQLLSNEVDYLAYLHETPPIYEDFNSFTKTLIEGEESGGSPAPENVLNHTADHGHSFVLMENHLLGSKESLEGEILNPTEEEFYVDVEGFVQTPLSVYGPSCI